MFFCRPAGAEILILHKSGGSRPRLKFYAPSEQKQKSSIFTLNGIIWDKYDNVLFDGPKTASGFNI